MLCWCLTVYIIWKIGIWWKLSITKYRCKYHSSLIFNEEKIVETYFLMNWHFRPLILGIALTVNIKYVNTIYSCVSIKLYIFYYRYIVFILNFIDYSSYPSSSSKAEFDVQKSHIDSEQLNEFPILSFYIYSPPLHVSFKKLVISINVSQYIIKSWYIR